MNRREVEGYQQATFTWEKKKWLEIRDRAKQAGKTTASYIRDILDDYYNGLLVNPDAPQPSAGKAAAETYTSIKTIEADIAGIKASMNAILLLITSERAEKAVKQVSHQTSATEAAGLQGSED